MTVWCVHIRAEHPRLPRCGSLFTSLSLFAVSRRQLLSVNPACVIFPFSTFLTRRISINNALKEHTDTIMILTTKRNNKVWFESSCSQEKWIKKTFLWSSRAAAADGCICSWISPNICLVIIFSFIFSTDCLPQDNIQSAFYCGVYYQFISSVLNFPPF